MTNIIEIKRALEAASEDMVEEIISTLTHQTEELKHKLIQKCQKKAPNDIVFSVNEFLSVIHQFQPEINKKIQLMVIGKIINYILYLESDIKRINNMLEKETNSKGIYLLYRWNLNYQQVLEKIMEYYSVYLQKDLLSKIKELRDEIAEIDLNSPNVSQIDIIPQITPIFRKGIIRIQKIEHAFPNSSYIEECIINRFQTDIKNITTYVLEDIEIIGHNIRRGSDNKRVPSSPYIYKLPLVPDPTRIFKDKK